MRIYRNLESLAVPHRGSVAAIGNFDGLHVGHRFVIESATEIAAESGVASAVLTFEPHPKAFFVPTARPFRLTNSEGRARLLREIGIDLLFELPFGRELASLDPEAFARRILRDALGVSCVVVGQDFRYGRKRAGNPAHLAESGRRLGFEVVVVPMRDAGGERCSSSAVRKALSEGRLDDAATMLGRRYRIYGKVQEGERRGRKLGFPTINLPLDGLHPPRLGVYATMVEIETGRYRGKRKGVASIGTRPTYGDNEPNLEVHLFDFDGNLYGESVSVEPVAFLRDEEKFNSTDALVRQMEIDCTHAAAKL